MRVEQISSEIKRMLVLYSVQFNLLFSLKIFFSLIKVIKAALQPLCDANPGGGILRDNAK